MSIGTDHMWRESEGRCMNCGLDMEAMLADVREHGYPTCDPRTRDAR